MGLGLGLGLGLELGLAHRARLRPPAREAVGEAERLLAHLQPRLRRDGVAPRTALGERALLR